MAPPTKQPPCPLLECLAIHSHTCPLKCQDQCPTPEKPLRTSTNHHDSFPTVPTTPALCLPTLSSHQSKYTDTFVGLVALCGLALGHPASPMLLESATAGCDATINNWWNMNLLEATIAKEAPLQPFCQNQPHNSTQKHSKKLDRDMHTLLPGMTSNTTTHQN